ncbi:MAG TPA: hypothetical protein VFU46_08475, partial [Gemmatimonadales bacterium]|nr:hypothetical protein [Gemmatimonadales bacterium]
MSAALRPAAPADYPAVAALLGASRLPLDGVPAALGGFVVAEADRKIVGVAGVEAYGDAGLLRSVAVAAT